jgi:hypothetical protein
MSRDKAAHVAGFAAAIGVSASCRRRRPWASGDVCADMPTLALAYVACTRRCHAAIDARCSHGASDAIWRVFDAAMIDRHSATLALLAISIGIRRTLQSDLVSSVVLGWLRARSASRNATTTSECSNSAAASRLRQQRDLRGEARGSRSNPRHSNCLGHRHQRAKSRAFTRTSTSTSPMGIGPSQ